MGINWSDILYPGNPGRRHEVNKLAQSIRTSVDQIFGNVRTMSKTLNKACSKFQVLDPLDLSITYDANFKKLQAVLAQWECATKEMEMDPSIPQEIKDLMGKFEEATSVGQFPDTVKDILAHVRSIAGIVTTSVVSLVAGSVATYFIKKSLSTVISSTIKAAAAAGLLGSVVGTAVGVLVDIIVAAIEGDLERTDLEKLKREYTAMDKNLRADLDALEDGVADVVHAIIKAMP